MLMYSGVKALGHCSMAAERSEPERTELTSLSQTSFMPGDSAW